jgi:hypothetical protein
MGGYLDTPDKAPAGTKRLSRRLALCQMGRRTNPGISRASGEQPVEHLENRRAGCGFPFGMKACGRSPKASRPKSMARCAEASLPGSRTSKRATTPRRAVPFSCLVCDFLAVILVGRDQQCDPPELAAMQWWTSRGPRASDHSR